MIKVSKSGLPGALAEVVAAGQVADADVDKVIRVAGRARLTGGELKLLQRWFKLRRPLFSPDAQLRMARFLAAASQPAQSPDPRVLKQDEGKVAWKRVRGALVRGGFSAADVRQGVAGDCYLMATLAAAAAKNPKLLSSALTEKADGTFVVRFYNRRPNGAYRPVYIHVDSELPMDKRGPRYGRTPRGELWPAIFEKAYAKWQGSYQKIGGGEPGDPGDVIRALTGEEGGVLFRADGQQAAWDRMNQVLATGGLVVASTGSDDAPYKGTGVIPRHAYSVLGVAIQGGIPVVILRNPWGDTEPGQPKRGDGVFKLSLARFSQLFEYLHHS